MVWYLYSLGDAGELLERLVEDYLFMFVSVRTKDTNLWWPRGSYQPRQCSWVMLNCSSHHKLQLFLDSTFVTGIVYSISLYWHILTHVVSWFVHVQRNVISLDSFGLRLFPFSQKSLKYASSFTMILIARSFSLQLSILVHPDKNQDDADRAQKAFEGNTLSLS